MTPVDQTIVDKGRGDCQRASVATLLDLELEQVPNFRLFPDDRWYHVYNGFLWGCGYEWTGTGYPDDIKNVATLPNVGGYVIAAVPSKEFNGEVSDTGLPLVHAVVMDMAGLVVHDPQPNKAYQGVNIIETGDLLHWDLIEPRTD